MAERIREADAMVHLVAINLEDELKPLATGEGPASAEEAAEAAAAEVVEAAVAAAAEVVVVEEADDDASCRLGPQAPSQ